MQRKRIKQKIRIPKLNLKIETTTTTTQKKQNKNVEGEENIKIRKNKREQTIELRKGKETLAIINEEGIIVKEEGKKINWIKKINDINKGKKLEEYEKGKKLGEGACGKVEERKRRGKKVADKIIRIEEEGEEEEEERNDIIVREIKFMAETRKIEEETTKGLVTLEGVYAERGEIHILMKIYEGTSIERDELREEEQREFIKQVIEGMNKMHKRGYIHRDIKPENMLMNKEKTEFALADYGFVIQETIKEDGTMKTQGTAAYMSQLRLNGQGATKACDRYALGLTICTMLNKNSYPKNLIASNIFSRLEKLKLLKEKQSPTTFLLPNQQINPELVEVIDDLLKGKKIEIECYAYFKEPELMDYSHISMKVERETK
mmetsp:Transcript_12913/g.19454  ORF Transcript_12913/g.19454 Transcript_12913/m.19454 type:complete len:376 (-) Transcript_12913:78-1205(-)